MNITDVKIGRNVTVVKHANKKDPKLTRYEVIPEFDPTTAPVSANTEFTDLSTIGKIYSFDEATKLLSEGVGAGFKALLGPGTQETPQNTESFGDEIPADFDAGIDDLEKQMQAALQDS